MENRKFDGTATPELEEFLGSNLAKWLPDQHAALIRFDDGFEAIANAGDTFRRTDAGLIEIWHA